MNHEAPDRIPSTFEQWIVASASADSDLGIRHFEKHTLPMPEIGPGQALVRVKLINIHSNTRLRMARGAIPVGQTDALNYACGEVVASRDEAFSVGDVVACQAGWQPWQVISSGDTAVGFSEPSELVKAVNGTRSPWTYAFRTAMARQWPPEVLMEIFGTSGMTAWFGMRECGPLMPRDGVLVAGASGGVGSIVAQLAKIAGCRVIGLAGGEEGCRWVMDTLGIDGCLDYRSPTLEDDLRDAFPEGIDVFSDGVGGSLTERVATIMNRHGRILTYGASAASYAPRIAPLVGARPPIRIAFGITETVEAILKERHLKASVFTVDSFYADRLLAEDDLSRQLTMGRLKAHGRVVRGFDHLPQAIVDLYRNRRAAKLQVSFD